MIVQIQRHQPQQPNQVDISDPRELVAQRNFVRGEDYLDVWAWVEDVLDHHPLPDGYRWLLCDETSEFMIRPANPSGSTP